MYNDRSFEHATYNNLQTARRDIELDKTSSKLNSVSDRLTVAECMIQALWNLLEKKGTTREELMEEITRVNEKKKNRYNKIPKYYCSSCGKVMQIGNKSPFLANCMYCGALKTINPYDDADDLLKFEPNNQPDNEQQQKDPLNDLNFL